MKKKLISIFLFFLLAGSIYAQDIVELPSFSPFAWKNDTLFFNSQRYEWVKVIAKNDQFGYVTNIYRLKNLSSLEHDLETSFSSVKFYGDYDRVTPYGVSDLYNVYAWANKKTPDYKTIVLKKNQVDKRLQKDIDFYLKESAIRMPYSKPDTSRKAFELPPFLFPKLEEVMNDFILLLHFQTNLDYKLDIYFKDSLEVNLNDFEVCNPVNYSHKKVYTSAELEDTLTSMLKQKGVPVFMIENKAFDFVVHYNLKSADYKKEKIWREKQDLVSHSVKVFPGNDILLAMPDSFNNRTFFYLPSLITEKTIGYIYQGYGLSDIKNQRIDINNDGRKDLVLDTMVQENWASPQGSHNIIQYIPDYADTSYYLWDVFEGLVYDRDLGNRFYYVGDDDERLFAMRKGVEKDIISIVYETYYIKDNVHYRVKLYVENNPALSLTLPPKGAKTRKMVDQVHELIRYYLEHPEKLTVDFPEK